MKGASEFIKKSKTSSRTCVNCADCRAKGRQRNAAKKAAPAKSRPVVKLPPVESARVVEWHGPTQYQKRKGMIDDKLSEDPDDSGSDTVHLSECESDSETEVVPYDLKSDSRYQDYVDTVGEEPEDEADLDDFQPDECDV